MATVDVGYQWEMCYSTLVGGEYYFGIRIQSYLEIQNQPILQLGVSKIPNNPSSLLRNLLDLMLSIIQIIPAGEEYPLCNHTGTWVAPVDLKLDRMSAFSCINPQGFAQLTVVPLSVPTFLYATAVFIPVADDYSAVPDVPEGYDVVDEDRFSYLGTIYIPTVAGWSNRQEWIIDRHTQPIRQTLVRAWGLPCYNGQDLPDFHILFNYTEYDDTSNNAAFWDNEIWGILDPQPWEDFVPISYSPPYHAMYYVMRYEHDDAIFWYPERDKPSNDGTQIRPILPKIIDRKDRIGDPIKNFFGTRVYDRRVFEGYEEIGVNGEVVRLGNHEIAIV